MIGTRQGDADGIAASAASADAGGDETQTGDRNQTMQTVDSRGLEVVADGALERGQSVGRYVIYDLLGAGGMGAVYRAYDPELNRGVALKVLTVQHRRNTDVSLARARLEREAQAMAQLSHPNVVAVHDVGRFDEDLFIAMELVEGQTLKQWRKAEPRSRGQILAVFQAAGRGLAAAHGAGMVHRDFKPDNVLVGNDGRVRVADFGLARGAAPEDTADSTLPPGDTGDAFSSDAISAELESMSDYPTGQTPSSVINTPLTQAGAIMGTPAYMAPEQYYGTSVDAATDQFSFCVALYEALYGTRPFRAKDPRSLRQEVLAGRVAAAPAGTKVPGWLRKIVVRGLSVPPTDRYPSMAALLAELGRDPARARRRWIAAALAVICVALLGAGWLRDSGAAPQTLCTAPERWLTGVWDDDARATFRDAIEASDVYYASATAERVERILDAYADEWTSVHTQACKATHIHGTQSDDMLDLRMQCLDRSNARVTAFVGLVRDELDASLLKNAVKTAVQTTDLARCSDVNALRAQQDYPEPKDPEQRARIAALQKRIDELDVLLMAGRSRQGVALGETVVADADTLGYAPVQAEARRILGSLLSHAGDAQASEDSFSHGIADAARAGDQQGEASMVTKRIWVLGHLMERHDAALALVPCAEAAIVRAGDTPQLRQNLLNSIGAVHFTKGEFEQARDHWRRRLKLLEGVSEANDPAVGWAFNNLSAAHIKLKDFDTAIELLERARAIWERTLGQDHPAMAALLTNLGIAYRNSGRLDEAVDVQQRALASFERVHGPDHHEVAMTLINLGAVFKVKGDFAAAELQFRRALGIFERQTGPTTHLTAVAIEQVGVILNDQERHAEAADTYRRALEVYEATIGRDDPRTGSVYRDLGMTLVRLGDEAGAVSALETALENLEANESPAVPQVQIELAQTLVSAGTGHKRARSLAKAARDQLATRPGSEDQVRAIDDWLQQETAN